MTYLFKIKPGWQLGIYCTADIICTGAGMGVPIFCIFFGFLTGWFIVKKVSQENGDWMIILKRTLKYAVITSLVTFLIMLIIWGRTIVFLFDPGYDYSKFGHPFILYTPKASFIAWLVLMILISPFLQLLTTIFSGYITLIGQKNHHGNS
ncbi:MAG: hypothetical protein D4R64_02120 [Porphyromonadaceae bacterium]|nr:MAG: hypothetical protein D4R64_02120 [Porphyromonadaceae bacterium]